MLFLTGNTIVRRTLQGMRREYLGLTHAEAVAYVQQINAEHIQQINYLLSIFDDYTPDQILQQYPELLNLIQHLPESDCIPGFQLTDQQVISWQHQQLLTAYNQLHQTGYQLSHLTTGK